MAFKVTVIETSKWGAKPPKSQAALTTPSAIVIHHTGGAPSSGGTESGGKTLAKSIQNHHMNTNKWIDSGHNFLNTIGGHILEGRHGTVAAVKKGKCVRSAHAGSNLGNQSPGIENEGLYTTATMPDKQWDSLVALCADLCRNCNIPPSQIKGHRDFSATQCPGDWLYAQLPKLRKAVADYMKNNP